RPRRQDEPDAAAARDAVQGQGKLFEQRHWLKSRFRSAIGGKSHRGALSPVHGKQSARFASGLLFLEFAVHGIRAPWPTCVSWRRRGTTWGMAILITLQGPDTGRKYALDSPTTILGRQADSQICLAAKAVSRQHAQIVKTNSSFYLEDLDSSN